jgi:histidinol-phosphatase (PHP family)
MIPHDYHIHTHFSCDSDASMLSMCRAAINVAIPEIGISEHFDLNPIDPCVGFFRADDWWEELSRCRKELNGVLTIRAGIELSEPHLYPEAVEALLENYPWDYALGALHWIGKELIFEEEYFNRAEQVAYTDYFIELQRLAQSGLFDILAHMDIVKRYGFEHYGNFDPQKYEGQIRSILQVLVSSDLALEVNTVTLRRSILETSPSRQILQWFLEEGGQWLTLGSDAHEPKTVGAGIEKTLSLIQSLGFKNLASFKRRKPKHSPLS